jgi:hypothetical protein
VSVQRQRGALTVTDDDTSSRITTPEVVWQESNTLQGKHPGDQGRVSGYEIPAGAHTRQPEFHRVALKLHNEKCCAQYQLAPFSGSLLELPLEISTLR